VLSDKNKRAVYDQYGEEGLKGGGGPPPGAASGGAFGGSPGGSYGFPGGATFSFSNAGGGGSQFEPTDPMRIFE